MSKGEWNLQKSVNPMIYIEASGFKGDYIKLLWGLTFFLPLAYFLVSLFVSPVVSYDTGIGFLALRSMLQGGPFNTIVGPDPANIANDFATFLTLYSPGQYLAPGFFIWLGFNYETAISLTVLAATIAGVFGWYKVAEAFGAPRSLAVFFALCLVVSYYVPECFQVYSQEIVLFAVAPWALFSLWYGAKASPLVCFAIALATGALLFFAKLTGLVVFASTVLAISLVEILQKRRITGAVIALGAASGTAALCFLVFWHSRGPVAASVSKLTVTWANAWFAVAAASLSGVSGIQLLNWFSHTLTSPGPHQQLVEAVALLSLAAVAAIGWSLRKQIGGYSKVPFRAIIIAAVVAALLAFLALKFNRDVGIPYRDPHFIRDVMLSVIGCVSLYLATWIWKQLQSTPYRTTAVLFLAIIFIYIALMTVMFNAGSDVSMEERHLRYAGILFFLLFLIALDQRNDLRATYVKVLIVGIFGGFGLLSYASNARELTEGRYYDPLDFSLPHRMPPSVLEYLRSEQSAHKWRRPVALIPQEAVFELPQFRLIGLDARAWTGEWAQKCRLRGRSEKLFVIIPEEVPDSRSAALLKCLQDYDQNKWSRLQIGGMAVYTQ
jgi:hypothetical protein